MRQQRKCSLFRICELIIDNINLQTCKTEVRYKSLLIDIQYIHLDWLFLPATPSPLWWSCSLIWISGIYYFSTGRITTVVNIITTNKKTTPSYAHSISLHDVTSDVCTMRERPWTKSEHPLPYIFLFNRDTYSAKRKIHTDMSLLKSLNNY